MNYSPRNLKCYFHVIIAMSRLTAYYEHIKYYDFFTVF